ncbi:MAG: HNH endonuclease [bacterium]
MTQYRTRAGRILWQAVREYALLRDRYTCQVCGSGEDLTLHHLKTREEGGSDDAGNLITVCRSCHVVIHKPKGVLVASLHSKHRGLEASHPLEDV